MTPFLLDEIIDETDALDAMTEWDSDDDDLAGALREMRDDGLDSGRCSREEDEGIHPIRLARRLH